MGKPLGGVGGAAARPEPVDAIVADPWPGQAKAQSVAWTKYHVHLVRKISLYVVDHRDSLLVVELLGLVHDHFVQHRIRAGWKMRTGARRVVCGLQLDAD